MRNTSKGLHIGTLIHVVGAGRHAKGTISREPEDGATHIHYRSDYNGGERIAKIESVRQVQMRRRASAIKKQGAFAK